MECVVITSKGWTCIVCHAKIHGAGEDCTCSTYRAKEFHHASLCIACASAYDRLISDPELNRVVQHLKNKKYWEGVGPFHDS